MVFIAEPGKGVPAVVRSMLFAGSVVENPMLLEKGIKLAAANGELFFAVHEFGFIESVINVGEGSCRRYAVSQVFVVIHKGVVGGIPVFVITDCLCGIKRWGDARGFGGRISGVGLSAVAAESFDAAEAVW